MTAQLDLLGSQLRDEGHAKVLAVLSPASVSAIEAAIRSCAGITFTADVVRDRLPYEVARELDQRPNALGALFRLFAKRGEIEPTDRFVHSERDNARHRRLTVWRWRSA